MNSPTGRMISMTAPRRPITFAGAQLGMPPVDGHARAAVSLLVLLGAAFALLACGFLLAGRLGARLNSRHDRPNRLDAPSSKTRRRLLLVGRYSCYLGGLMLAGL